MEIINLIQSNLAKRTEKKKKKLLKDFIGEIFTSNA